MVCRDGGRPEKVRKGLDLKPLNKSALREVHPLPKVDETLAQLAGAKVFSKLDANSGFGRSLHGYHMVSRMCINAWNYIYILRKSHCIQYRHSNHCSLGLDKICFFLRLFCFAFLLQILTHFAFYFTYFAYFLLQKFSLKLNTYN